jgi:hypothetical protein
MAIKEWIKLKATEAKLIGELILSTKSRIDPAFDIKSIKPFSLSISYPPYDAVYSDPKDRQDQAKRKAYDESVAEKIRLVNLYSSQVELQNYLSTFMRLGREHLKLLYADQNPIDPEEMSILKSTGLDQKTIDLLTVPGAEN